MWNGYVVGGSNMNEKRNLHIDGQNYFVFSSVQIVVASLMAGPLTGFFLVSYNVFSVKGFRVGLVFFFSCICIFIVGFSVIDLIIGFVPAFIYYISALILVVYMDYLVDLKYLGKCNHGEIGSISNWWVVLSIIVTYIFVFFTIL